MAPSPLLSLVLVCLAPLWAHILTASRAQAQSGALPGGDATACAMLLDRRDSNNFSVCNRFIAQLPDQPGKVLYLELRAIWYERRGHFDLAIQDVDKALSILRRHKPDDSTKIGLLLLTRGRVHAAKGNMTAAEKDYRDALASPPYREMASRRSSRWEPTGGPPRMKQSLSTVKTSNASSRTTPSLPPLHARPSPGKPTLRPMAP